MWIVGCSSGKGSIRTARRRNCQMWTRTEQCTTSVFSADICMAAAITSDYPLRDSVILDSGATVHVCNDRRRFTNLRPAAEDDRLLAGGTALQMQHSYRHSTQLRLRFGASKQKESIGIPRRIPSHITTVCTAMWKNIVDSGPWNTMSLRKLHLQHDRESLNQTARRLR